MTSVSEAAVAGEETQETVAGEQTEAPALTGDIRLVLRPLSIQPHGTDDEIMVGDPAQGEFVVLPAVAGSVIEALGEGRTIEETAAHVLATTGTEIDVADFAEALIGLGFVAKVGDVETAAAAASDRTGGRWGTAAVRLLGPAFSRPAWALYALVFVADFLALVFDRALRPSGAALYFLHDPLLSLALLTATQIVLAFGHEGAHWIAGRRAGVPAGIAVGRRGYILVLQTDLSALRTVSRRARFGPLLAGLAFDSTVLAANLALRWTALHHHWHAPATLLGFLAGQADMQVLAMSMQLVIFLRSDLYGVLVLGFDCLDLSRVARLTLRAKFGRLDGEQRAELDRAGRADVRVARWYSWLLLVGAVLSAACLVVIVIPGVWHVGSWLRTALADHSPGTFGFWEPIVCAVVVLVPYFVAPLLAVRERTGSRAA
ncbi:hypothetical protein KGQ19_09500 [Catenulispora sp. NL8]|uniref:Peptidase M50 n=1 Tax=Catenulispora pinistramenti TaxID=2705254 RepID=A0ABS5KM66_9ACTN|nr:hypothetical protein [Catenulispora pinistramenti]MBS2547105.1 hypothetical protein [Catenulispora pinistramenti]